MEHPSDRTLIGIDAELNIGYAPLLGITCEIDVIDLVLTAAQAVPAAAGLARALQKARDAAAAGYGDKSSTAQVSAHVALKMAAAGCVGGGVTIKRSPSDIAWQGSGRVEGKIEFSLSGIVRAEGRVYIVDGSFSAESKGQTDITTTLSTLTPSESAAARGAKFNTKIEWAGIKISYKAVAAGRWGIGSATAERSGELIVMEEETLFENSY